MAYQEHDTVEDDVLKSALPSGKKVELNDENYVNHIIKFTEDSSSSNRYKDVVGSHLKFLGDRLDSLVGAANKGSHSDILTREEADRYVTYTYLLVGDVLSLFNEVKINKASTESIQV